MLIVSLVTERNQFLNRGISFSLRKSTRGNIYVRQTQSSLTLLSVKTAADQLVKLSSIFFAESGFEQQVSAKQHFDKHHALMQDRSWIIIIVEWK